MKKILSQSLQGKKNKWHCHKSMALLPAQKKNWRAAACMSGSTRVLHSKALLCFCKNLTVPATEEPSLHVKFSCPLVHITDGIQAETEHFCTGVPEPGLLGLISYDSPIAKNDPLHQQGVLRQTAKGLPLELHKIAVISRNSNIMSRDTKQTNKKTLIDEGKAVLQSCWTNVLK